MILFRFTSWRHNSIVGVNKRNMIAFKKKILISKNEHAIEQMFLWLSKLLTTKIIAFRLHASVMSHLHLVHFCHIRQKWFTSHNSGISCWQNVWQFVFALNVRLFFFFSFGFATIKINSVINGERRTLQCSKEFTEKLERTRVQLLRNITQTFIPKANLKGKWTDLFCRIYYFIFSNCLLSCLLKKFRSFGMPQKLILNRKKLMWQPQAIQQTQPILKFWNQKDWKL